MLRCGATVSSSGLLWLAMVAVVCSLSPAHAAAAAQPSAVQSTGRTLYEAACAACHAANGRGSAAPVVGFGTPLPDFTDCGFATPEPDVDWMAVIHDGGPARAFDRRMPAFGEALTGEELQQVLDYTRTFCRSTAWPRGELNLPRALVTEKAFPENEAVLTTSFATGGAGHAGQEFLYERRLGPRSQFEIAVPVLFEEQADGAWSRGLGDVAVAFKHALFHSLQRGSIFSVAGEFILPTGKESEGLGNGVTVFEPFAAFGLLLPADGFVQLQAGFELPVDADRADKEAFWRAAVGKTLTQGRFGRSWSPMVELLASRALEDEARVQWDLLPQMQVTLSRRQHIMLNAGVRLPLNDRVGRHTQVLTYFLWDWFDGGLFDGWR